MFKRKPKRDPALDEITAWKKWFIDAHEERLSRPWEFPDRHLVEEERVKILALAEAIADRMYEDHRARQVERAMRAELLEKP